jgi:Uma2 family endonuclease
VPEYAIIDPKARQLRLCCLNQEGQYTLPLVFGEPDTVTLAILPNISFVGGDLFAGAPDPTI